MASFSTSLAIDALTGESTVPADPVAEQILDAALAQIQDFGLRRTSIDDVARRAGLSRITIYRRFPNRDRLIESTFMRECRRFIRHLDAAVMPLRTTEERLVEGFVVAIRTARAHPLISRLLASDPEVLLPFLTVRAGPAIAIARTYLAARIRQVVAIAEVDAEQVAEVLVRLALSFVLVGESCVALDNDREIRVFARRHIVPMVTGATMSGRKTSIKPRSLRRHR